MSALAYQTLLATSWIVITHEQGLLADDTESSGQLGLAASWARLYNPFSLFTVVRFSNTECEGSSGDNGTCYTLEECESRGGAGEGSCASGFGTCCVFQRTCYEETNQNNTYFIKQETRPKECSLLIRPVNDNICQVRLNLLKLELDDPDVNGQCIIDSLKVTGGVIGNFPPTICGTNTGQHIIYNTMLNVPTRLAIVVDEQIHPEFLRTWKIQILQFSCNDLNLAPDGCLQYLTGSSGSVRSFNWKTEDNRNMATFSNHLANQDYRVCVRREMGYCSIEWSVPSPPGMQIGYFSLTGAGAIATATIPDTLALAGDTDCRTDYVHIPRGFGGTDTTLSRDRFCGQGLAFCTSNLCTAADGTNRMIGPIKSTVYPFLLGVVTDGDETTTADNSGNNPDGSNRGFSLNYKQSSCP